MTSCVGFIPYVSFYLSLSLFFLSSLLQLLCFCVYLSFLSASIFLSALRNQTVLFGGANPRYENVPLIGRGSPPPSVRWVPENMSSLRGQILTPQDTHTH